MAPVIRYEIFSTVISCASRQSLTCQIEAAENVTAMRDMCPHYRGQNSYRYLRGLYAKASHRFYTCLLIGRGTWLRKWEHARNAMNGSRTISLWLQVAQLADQSARRADNSLCADLPSCSKTSHQLVAFTVCNGQPQGDVLHWAHALAIFHTQSISISESSGASAHYKFEDLTEHSDRTVCMRNGVGPEYSVLG